MTNSLINEERSRYKKIELIPAKRTWKRIQEGFSLKKSVAFFVVI
jgi:hypothetical protein